MFCRANDLNLVEDRGAEKELTMIVIDINRAADKSVILHERNILVKIDNKIRFEVPQWVLLSTLSLLQQLPQQANSDSFLD